MAGSTPLVLSASSQQGIIKFFTSCAAMMTQTWDMRSAFQAIDTEYMREGNRTEAHIRAVLSNAIGDKTRLQDLTVPVVMPQVETALSYLAGVFLSGHPIFGMVANAENMDAAIQMETIIEENARRNAWIREFILWLRDGLKYNLHCLEVSWQRKTIYQPITAIGKVGATKETLWQGNTIKRIDMYNAFFDTRVAPAEIHSEGEFAGYSELYSRMRLKRFFQDLPDNSGMNATSAFESMYNDNPAWPFFFTPLINPNALLRFDPRASTDWLAWASAEASTGKIRYNNLYIKTTLYARIIPSDYNMKVPAQNTPQIWKFIIINGNVLAYAERQTDAHNNLPMVFGQPLEDGLNYQTKSFASNGIAFQDMASALWASKLASERRSVGDRVLYNPLLINEKDINSANPSAKIPVRPAAYGRNLQESVYAFPFNNQNQSMLLSEAQQIVQMANNVAGQNLPSQGQFQKGNKTLHEFQTTMQNGNNREQMMALFIEAQSMTPIKEMLKLNILQYQPPGTVYSAAYKRPVQVIPEDLRKQELLFKVTDGMLPLDRLIETDFMGTFMQVIAADPQLNFEFDKVKLFTYFAKLRGMHEVADFARTPEEKQQMMKQQEEALKLEQAKTQNRNQETASGTA